MDGSIITLDYFPPLPEINYSEDAESYFEHGVCPEDMIDISTKSEVGWANSLALFSGARGIIPKTLGIA
ncbi:hypothetical protein I7I50_05024 [Histoplasma capsulatum G186AR]|uniref:Uncharacterized protein n=1 Tax=Ajellomyces capsulatus TaxID=5037 RepID=A0A8H7ZAL5_AJECA|nr:hypothetical protein I7I52_03282 [Histoplasma capsulatum]QSS75771.1 hypothetical protein I7I50_05024 [Histoplasma capsulatum G186AR]